MNLKILAIIALFLCSTFSAQSQATFHKLYWGNEVLEKSFKQSPVPPYDYDTTRISAYHLPYEIEAENGGAHIYALFQSEEDSLPTEMALYQDGKMNGFLIIWYKNDMVNIHQKPTGLDFNMCQGRILGASNVVITEGEIDYFNLEVSGYNPWCVMISIKINETTHTYSVSFSGGFVKEEFRTDEGDLKSYTLYHSSVIDE